MKGSPSQGSLRFSNVSFLRKLGRGTCGSTLCVTDADTGDVLVIRRAEAAAPLMEAARIKFPALAKTKGFYSVGSDEGFITRGFFEKGKISPSKMSATEKSIFIFGIAAGLNFLHQNGIVHGHLCPSNVMVTDLGEPALCDFGLHLLSRRYGCMLVAIGGAGYAAPELLCGDPATPEGDVFSFGMLVLDIITGANERVFGWEGIAERIRGARPEIEADVSKFYRDLIERCWDQRKEKRPSMAEVVSMLCNDGSFILSGADHNAVKKFQAKMYPNGFPQFVAPDRKLKLDLLPPIPIDNNVLLKAGNGEFFVRQRDYHILGSNNPRKLFQCLDRSGSRSDLETVSYFSSVEDDSEREAEVPQVEKREPSQPKPKKEKKPKERQNVVSHPSLKSVADSGNVEAQFQYGVLLLNGDGVPKNPVDGAKYVRLAADSGSLKAQRLYSQLALHGEGVTENKKASAHYLKLAAQNGDVESQYDYARMLETGENVAVNVKDAVKYYRMAALQGDVRSQRSLAHLLEAGKGVSKDVIEAIKFYRMAADQGDGEAQFRLSKLLPQEEGMVYMKASADNGIAEAQTEYGRLILQHDLKSGIKYLKLAIEQNDTNAMYYLGTTMYYNMPQSYQRSGLKYIKMACDARNPKAMFQYGLILGHLDFMLNDVPYVLTNAIASKDSNFADWPMLNMGITIEQICEESTALIQDAASLGLAEAQFFFGVMLQYGDAGLEIDLAEALKYYKLAADQGHMHAQVYAALLLDDGKGSAQNMREAAKYYRMAADQGHPVAQMNYAYMLFDGRGTNRNRKDAAKYFTSCADAGYVAAQYKLALMLYNGQGVPRNTRLAIKYFQRVVFDKHKLSSKYMRLPHEISQVQMVHESARCIRSAAESGCVEAQQVYAWLLMAGEVFQKDVKEAMSFFRKAADKGDRGSQYYLGLHLSATPGANNINEAARYFKLAADQNYPQAQFQYALLLDNGDGMNRDYAEAAKYYKLAADQGISQAQICYGNMLESGEGTELNMAESARYYRMAARQGEVNAIIRYAYMLQEGIGVEKNKARAFKYYLKGAQLKNATAQYEVAKAYEFGDGVPKDIVKAAQYYEMVAHQPNMPQAQIRYADMLSTGEGVVEDLDEAMHYYKLASDGVMSSSNWIRMKIQWTVRWLQRITFFLWIVYLVFLR